MSTKNITKTISKILNELCEQKKDKDYTCSLVKQAEEVGIPYPTFIKYVNGKAECSAENLTKIANYYNVSTDLTDIKSTDTKVKDICDYTGLTEYSISLLHDSAENIFSISETILDTINLLLKQTSNSITYDKLADDFYFKENCLLSALYEYIRLVLNPENKTFYISESGNVFEDKTLDWNDLLNDNERDLFDLLTVKTVSQNDIILKVLLDNVCDCLKVARNEYQQEIEKNKKERKQIKEDFKSGKRKL